jgi:hypothetical protein
MKRGRDFVAKGLANLSDTERNFLPRSGEQVFEIQEMPLCRLGRKATLAASDMATDGGLKHDCSMGHGESGFVAHGDGFGP